MSPDTVRAGELTLGLVSVMACASKGLDRAQSARALIAHIVRRRRTRAVVSGLVVVAEVFVAISLTTGVLNEGGFVVVPNGGDNALVSRRPTSRMSSVRNVRRRPCNGRRGRRAK